jgi:tryptophan 2,3-dioxygenase
LTDPGATDQHQAPYLDAVAAYVKREPARLHVPGHKGTGTDPGLIEVYRDVERHWPFYQLAEKLMDMDDALATWRHKHVVTVERVIGLKRGTGGTPGVPYLQSTLAKRAFPELWSLRTKL